MKQLNLQDMFKNIVDYRAMKSENSDPRCSASSGTHMLPSLQARCNHLQLEDKS
jgi:hypothetical protein